MILIIIPRWNIQPFSYSVLRHGIRTEQDVPNSSSSFCKVLDFFSISMDTLFIFYENIVFPTEAEYSYFSGDFRLKIFL